jgi:hypothetical protein
MVMNSFGKRKFHATNGKAGACTQGALLFFPFKFWGTGWGAEGARIFFHFLLVLNVFPLGYLKVGNGFPICSPTCSS